MALQEEAIDEEDEDFDTGYGARHDDDLAPGPRGKQGFGARHDDDPAPGPRGNKHGFERRGPFDKENEADGAMMSTSIHSLDEHLHTSGDRQDVEMNVPNEDPVQERDHLRGITSTTGAHLHLVDDDIQHHLEVLTSTPERGTETRTTRREDDVEVIRLGQRPRPQESDRKPKTVDVSSASLQEDKAPRSTSSRSRPSSVPPAASRQRMRNTPTQEQLWNMRSKLRDEMEQLRLECREAERRHVASFAATASPASSSRSRILLDRSRNDSGGGGGPLAGRGTPLLNKVSSSTIVVQSDQHHYKNVSSVAHKNEHEGGNPADELPQADEGGGRGAAASASPGSAGNFRPSDLNCHFGNGVNRQQILVGSSPATSSTALPRRSYEGTSSRYDGPPVSVGNAGTTSRVVAVSPGASGAASPGVDNQIQYNNLQASSHPGQLQGSAIPLPAHHQHVQSLSPPVHQVLLEQGSAVSAPPHPHMHSSSITAQSIHLPAAVQHQVVQQGPPSRTPMHQQSASSGSQETQQHAQQQLQQWNEAMDVAKPILEQLCHMATAEDTFAGSAALKAIQKTDANGKISPFLFLSTIESVAQALRLWQEQQRDLVTKFEEAVRQLKVSKKEVMSKAVVSIERKTRRIEELAGSLERAKGELERARRWREDLDRAINEKERLIAEKQLQEREIADLRAQLHRRSREEDDDQDNEEKRKAADGARLQALQRQVANLENRVQLHNMRSKSTPRLYQQRVLARDAGATPERTRGRQGQRKPLYNVDTSQLSTYSRYVERDRFDRGPSLYRG
ncbi:unnamed protein product [Amoebophrya sp. A25]|nr:unnamed protein product [Amoebophrya sp. A25]|eukprot:GSA25T00017058001.1